MSQLQVTGEAKIRDIQGPVVANSGVITALDGAASQYVRGDGTLADFPTSTGGGSSVSYYLNSSVSQGTIGGVAYRQLGKTPIAGAGTDITISANGYVASYITDANDPSLLEVPAGNFNCEFYFSVNNNTGNPYVYAEIYKYDGATFTLLGSSVGVPEYITEGTVINPYYFAVPVAVSALSVTDRIAIRIYVNVDGRIVTLHTENNHLCQVVTTFSKGLISLNNLTRQNQFFQTGTSGTDFGISSSVATHTFNLPVASATNTGKLSNTDWSTFNNKQAALSFTAPLVNTSNTISIPAATSLVDGYLDNLDWVNFNTAYNDSIVSAAVTGTTTKTLTLNQQDGGTITASWTDDNTYAVTSVFGRTGAVVAASGDYTTTQVTEGTNLYYTDARSRGALSFTAGSGAYNSTTGVITIPTNNNQITNGAGYITSSALSGYLPLTGGTLTGALSGTSATFSSTTTATAFIPSGSTIPTNGMYLSAANTLNFATNSANRFTIASDGVATFGTDLYVNRNIYVTDIEAGVGANYFSPYSGGSTPLSFNYNSAGSVVWNNGGTKMTLTSAGALQLVSSISATSATLNGNVIINSTATALSPLQVVATGTIVRLGEQSGTTGKQFLIGIDATSGRSELQSVWQGTSFTSLALQPSGGNVLIGTTGDNGAKLQVSGSATFSGNFGVGTASPSDRLNVVVSANGNVARFDGPTSGLILQTNATTTDIISYGGTTPAYRTLNFATSATTALSITTTGAATFTSTLAVGTTISAQNGGTYAGSAEFAGILRIQGVGGRYFTSGNGLEMSFNSIYSYNRGTNAYNDLAINDSMVVKGGNGNVGIGTSSPTNISGYGGLTINGTNGAYTYWNINGTDTGRIITDSTNFYFDNVSTGATIFRTTASSTERMRITSDGRFLVGATATDSGCQFRFVYNGSSQNGLQLFDNTNTSGSTFLIFGINNGGNINIGSISRIGATSAVAYNTTSDYRLKEDLKEINGLEKVLAIKVYDFKWKGIEDRMDGVLAHELQDVIPYAVLGEKDGEQMQSVDYSKLVPILVKSIQELKAEIDILKNK